VRACCSLWSRVRPVEALCGCDILFNCTEDQLTDGCAVASTTQKCIYGRRADATGGEFIEQHTAMITVLWADKEKVINCLIVTAIGAVG
jgi:hypothetical protein